MGSCTKSYMRKGFLILYMRKCTNISPYTRRLLVIYDFAPDPSEFPVIWENFIFFFVSAASQKYMVKKFSWSLLHKTMDQSYWVKSSTHSKLSLVTGEGPGLVGPAGGSGVGGRHLHPGSGPEPTVHHGGLQVLTVATLDHNRLFIRATVMLSMRRYLWLDSCRLLPK
jgi:NADH:ubiquinone oxidoreductase subunit